ncbi:MAG: ATP-binding cassette domain-containing protein [Planctomycetota bacterium]
MQEPSSTAGGGALRIRDLIFAYPGASEPTVRVRDFRLGTAEQVVVTGSSGRGKSTLLHLVAGLMRPGSGEVVVADAALGAMKGSELDRFRGRHIGMVFQTFQLLHGFTALENVQAALMFSDLPRSQHKDRGLALLERLGLDRPHAPAEELSVGQQQRVAVARAVACRPTLVLADEPTASLDEDNAAEAVRLLKEACTENGAALMCVTHDRSLIPVFDRHESLDTLGQKQTEVAGA